MKIYLITLYQTYREKYNTYSSFYAVDESWSLYPRSVPYTETIILHHPVIVNNIRAVILAVTEDV